MSDETAAFLERVAEALDLDAVARACQALYGDPEREHYVYGDHEAGMTSCREDSEAVRDRYRDKGMRVPPRLSVDVAT